MKFRPILFICLALFATRATAQGFPTDAPLLTLDSVQVKYSDIITPGHVTMVVLWNSMMRPAKDELDSLHKVYPVWKEKYGVEIIALAWEYSKFPENLKKFLAKRTWTYKIYQDKGDRFGGSTGVTTMPATFFFDKQGKMVHRTTGFDPVDILKYEEKLKELYGN